MTTVPLAHINLPRHADKTPPLVPPFVRAERARDWLEETGRAWCGIVELWSVHERILEAPVTARIEMAPPNNRLPGPAALGTGIWWDRGAIRKRGNFRHLHVPWSERPLGLNMPQCAFTVNKTAVSFDSLVVHAPRMKDAPAVNARVQAAAIDRALALHERHGRPLILSADMNDGNAWRDLERAGFSIGIQHGVDVIAGLGVKSWKRGRAWENLDGVWSDHAPLTVDAVLV